MSSSAPGNAVRELYAALWHHAEGARPQMLSATALLTASQFLRHDAVARGAGHQCAADR